VSKDAQLSFVGPSPFVRSLCCLNLERRKICTVHSSFSFTRIKIGGQTPAPNSQDTELPDSVRRMGKFLLSMLRIEYEKRNVPIANLSISEANTRLKDLIKKYMKKVYPFDRKLRTNEIAYEWWSYLDKDRSGDAQPLAVCQTRS
jgi:hypothetical protein